MPITLDKLFSETVSSEFEYLGETVHITWAPARYTGEMDDHAAKMDEEIDEDSAAINEAAEAGNEQEVKNRLAKVAHRNRVVTRTFLEALLVDWDVLDGKRVVPINAVNLAKMPSEFLSAIFREVAGQNQVDPPTPDRSNGHSEPKASPATSRRGSRSSGGLTTSASHRGK